MAQRRGRAPDSVEVTSSIAAGRAIISLPRDLAKEDAAATARARPYINAGRFPYLKMMGSTRNPGINTRSGAS